MMPHDENWELLLAEYLDQTLPAALRQQVEAHLAECPACREDLSAARAALNLPEPATLAPIPPAAPFLEAVVRRADRAAVANGTAPQLHPRRGLVASLMTRLAENLAERDQAGPVIWFLLSLPIMGALYAPDMRAVVLAAGCLSLGALIEYLVTKEVLMHDPR